MRILVKSQDWHGDGSVVCLTGSKKEREMLRLLINRNYAEAIKYLLNFGDEAEKLSDEDLEALAPVDLVLTPESVHWDLVK